MTLAFLALATAAEPTAPCQTGGRPTGPVSTALLPGALGIVRDPCVRTEVGVAAGGNLLVDTADFYGRIQVATAVDGRIGVSDRVEVFARVEAFRLDNVIAPVSVANAGLGATALGASVLLDETERGVLAVHGRVVLPTAPFVNAAPLALDVGLSSLRTVRNGAVHGGLTLYGRTMLGRGPALPRGGLAGRVGVVRHLSPNGVSVVLDVPVSLGWTGGLDHLGLAGAVRLGTGGPTDARGGFVELGLMAPLLGNDRILVAGELRAGYRFR
jgi:hypothetical protein